LFSLSLSLNFYDEYLALFDNEKGTGLYDEEEAEAEQEDRVGKKLKKGKKVKKAVQNKKGRNLISVLMVNGKGKKAKKTVKKKKGKKDKEGQQGQHQGEDEGGEEET
jgi:hypothetical protein